MTEKLLIDGAHGEGGGQILRTALSLCAITGRAARIENIRANRPNPGLAAQHLTAVEAVAALCAARVEGGVLGSQTICFDPQGPPLAGEYFFDVAKAREGGSAGAATLVLQAVLLPLALAGGDSFVVIRGGTHMAWSPPFDYAREVWLHALAAMGVNARLELLRWGWYPAGGGEMRVQIHGLGGGGRQLSPVILQERGTLRGVRGRAVAANLPSHIAQRMTDRARSLLGQAGIAAELTAERITAASPGAGIFLTAEYENLRSGFCALGERGKPSETVAGEAVAALLAHRDSGAALDAHLADQLVVAAALARGRSEFSVESITRHLATNAWVVERFGLARIRISARENGTGILKVNR